MKKFTVGIFENREDAEKAINRTHNELNIPTSDLSFVYRNSEGEVREVQAADIATSTPAEGAGKGAAVGATIGAIAGLATVAGVIPVIGPLFAAGPLAVALGLTGAVGATAAAAATGAIAGGLIGALTNLGVGEENAKRYADRVQAGDVLVAAYAEEEVDVRTLFLDAGAIETEGYALKV
ncbi:MAG: hypothetical protein AB202_02235 [Parcubacteria bacterium C7867-007]|nr:MAG: hypothetical protein AB202_02235 [Parcubacteria bacterium C7867-007]